MNAAPPPAPPAPSRRARVRSSFAPQAALILLPLVLLTVVGLLSLRQDRSLATRQAQESAALLASRWSRDLAREFAAVLENQAATRTAILQDARAFLRQDPGFPSATQDALPPPLAAWLEEAPAPPATRVELAPDGHPAGVVLPSRLGLPAPWLRDLPPDQRSLWYAAQEALAQDRPDDARQPIEALAAGDHPAPLRANAALLLALLTATTATPAEALAALRQVRDAHGDATTETGFPVGQLAWLRALQLQPDGTGLDHADLAMIARFSDTAFSPLVPLMTAELERLVRPGHAHELLRLRVLQQLIATRQATVAAADALRLLDPVPAATGTVHWVRSGHWNLLAIRLPATATNTPPATPLLSAPSIAHLYSDGLVWSAVARCAADAAGTVPAYARLTLSLGGREVLPDVFGSPATGLDGLPLLAEAAGPLPVPGSPPGTPAPEFHVRVHLADAALLYRQQRERAGLIGGFILLATATAVAGLISAHRTFLRQARLARMKSDFVSSVSHELRAPIASVRLLAEGLDRGRVTDPARQREYFGLIVQECRRLSALIENVLDFSRIDQGRKRYEFEPTDLLALTTQTVRLMEPYAAERQVPLRFEPPTEFPVHPAADGKALQQALVNLIDNAIKHSPAGSPVTVSLAATRAAGEDAKAQPPAFQVSVTDHGPGIPTTEHARIFEPFHRLGSELRRETPGVGIGLSIVKHIVDAHHGHVRVESTPGRGSRFTLELPLAPLPSPA